VARWNGDRPRLDEEDKEGWQQLTRRPGKRLNLIGYDFFTTNVTRLQRASLLRAANGVLVKGEPERNP
jgi:enolase